MLPTVHLRGTGLFGANCTAKTEVAWPCQGLRNSLQPRWPTKDLKSCDMQETELLCYIIDELPCLRRHKIVTHLCWHRVSSSKYVGSLSSFLLLDSDRLVREAITHASLHALGRKSSLGRVNINMHGQALEYISGGVLAMAPSSASTQLHSKAAT